VAKRTDYYRDPGAPRPNSLVPGGAALVVDQQGRILLQRRADSGNWSLPGGVMELGETMGHAVVREVREETGLDVELTGILGAGCRWRTVRLRISHYLRTTPYIG
jgi:ADP-ribose pyrophosphatase YjhB (NUDIX family)